VAMVKGMPCFAYCGLLLAYVLSWFNIFACGYCGNPGRLFLWVNSGLLSWVFVIVTVMGWLWCNTGAAKGFVVLLLQ